MKDDKNVLREPLEVCCINPKTGFYRTGSCETGPQDFGTHVVCARVTKDFLDYTKGQGNDLSTPSPNGGFPGLKPGDKWCLCATRWIEAMRAGVAPPVVLSATHESVLDYVPFDYLKKHATDMV